MSTAPAPAPAGLAAADPGRLWPAIPVFPDVRRHRPRCERRAVRLATLAMAMGRPAPAVAGRARGIAVHGTLRAPLCHPVARAFTMARA